MPSVKKMASGEIERFWQVYRKKTVEKIIHPDPLGVPTSYSINSYDVALRYVMPVNFKDQNGAVVVKEGTVIEPLKRSRLMYDLVFIDGRDEQQVGYAIAHGAKLPTRIILTAGAPYDLRVKYANTEWLSGKWVPFFFDQRRMVLNSLKQYYGLNITSVPVVLSQTGSQLRVTYGMQR